LVEFDFIPVSGQGHARGTAFQATGTTVVAAISSGGTLALSVISLRIGKWGQI